MSLSEDSRKALKTINALILDKRFSKADELLQPLVDLAIEEALLMKADLLLQQSPQIGLKYLFELCKGNIAGANFKAAFILYFHPEVGVDFRPYLFSAFKQGDPEAIIAAANLYLQQGFVAKASQILTKNRHISEVNQLTESLGLISDNEEALLDFNDIRRADLSKLTYESVAPEINLFYVDDFLTDFECLWLKNCALCELKRSMVVDGESGSNIVSNVRTGSVAQLAPTANDWVLLNIEMKIAAYFNIPIENGELSNVLKYEVGEEYKPHYDFFHPNDKGSEQALKDGGQRFKTVLIYLNDVEQGGDTHFPRLSKSVRAKQKRLVVFNNTDNSYGPLPLSLHQGMPVIKGEKWLYSKWLRVKPTSYLKCLQQLHVR
ncbi:2OG-Fe(II) oxygenase [Shewanella sp. 10N.286.52.A9]|uniref:2OG-Fe(II) oxygenase n=1 Tax=Shewanella sp. 10N.286.52.A9 TaxID=3229711 RepID=UPI003551B180